MSDYSNLFQYLFRPYHEQFDPVCVWEYFQHYGMKLRSSLTMKQRENLESDFVESNFFLFHQNYAGLHLK